MWFDKTGILIFRVHKNQIFDNRLWQAKNFQKTREFSSNANLCSDSKFFRGSVKLRFFFQILMLNSEYFSNFGIRKYFENGDMYSTNG